MNSINGNNNSDNNSRNSCGNSSGSNSVGNSGSNSNKKINSNNKVITFGCRLNACESEIINNFIQELGLDNFTIINTCAVTAEAERKLRQTIRKLHNENNEIKIILTGCAAELNPNFYIKMDGVIGIISNTIKLAKAEYEKYSKQNPSEKSYQKDNRANKAYKKVRGFLQIQNGCDQCCTYCIVRTTRGSNISFNEEEIAEQARILLKKGYKDIVLTGVNISAYGRDKIPQKNLAHIINYLLKNVPEIKRLGLSSLDPADIDADLIKIIANEERLLPHIHESIQSGDNLILKRMHRRHSREQIIELNKNIIEVRPDVIFGADIICGFPTENEEMFQNTKNLMKEAHITLLHAFPFSKRPETPAAMMPQVKKEIAKERVRELKILAQEILQRKLQEYVGKNVNVLAEDEKNAKTNSFLKVRSNEKMIAGQEYTFYCEQIGNGYLIGKPVR